MPAHGSWREDESEGGVSALDGAVRLRQKNPAQKGLTLRIDACVRQIDGEGNDCVAQRNPAADCRADRQLSRGESGGACAENDTVSRGRIRQRADERMDDLPAPKVLEELVEKGIAERFVVQIADATD